MSQAGESGFDSAILDKENHTIALIEVKAHPVERWESILLTQLSKLSEGVEFLLAIDPNRVCLYRPGGENVISPVLRFDTRKILEHYDPEVARRRVFESYLLTLVEAWFRDLAYHWKSENPPGSADLRRVGMLEKLAGGTTQRLGV